MNGKLYGVSIGPGDPELLTLKAVRTIEKCPVIAVPRTHGENTLAKDIAAQAADLSGKEILYLDFLMSSDQTATAAQHDRNAEKIAHVLQTGCDVALLNIGDVSIYSTFSYISERIQNMGYAVEIIPGVPSFCACAAALGMSLTEADTPLCIIPGSYTELQNALSLPGGKVIMKSGRKLPEIQQLIHMNHLEAHTCAVANCGLREQKLYRNVDGIEEGDYFLTLLIRP